ncbi:hypothetical protein Ocin01_17445 [Orchesella cincta]|uniref:Glucan 1,3-beta-glucosidase n=1 Tax=Orchesella cincta TaxID=48709 RepID=A0A1D2M8C3_ORCCI|nr:hypothetical protein Ocin01_17445 [Orchesella cincta]
MIGNPVLILVLGLFALIKESECQLGVVYSPFVTANDNPESTKSYTLHDVKVMLNLIENDNFHHVSTYSVGAPDEPFKAGSTRNDCTSVVHTSIAAAEINKDKKQRVLSVYQGLDIASSSTVVKLNSEIEVGFEIAQAANRIYKGTVPALVLNAGNGFSRLFPMLGSIRNISERAQATQLQLGVRLRDCEAVAYILKTNKQNKFVLAQVEIFDFVICVKMPTLANYSAGPGAFSEYLKKGFLELENAVKETEIKTKVMLETGWPSGMNSSNPYETVSPKILWEMMGQWANKEKRLVFINEAFDSPSASSSNFTENPFPTHYGLWKHKDTDMDYSQTSYVRKGAKLQTHNTLANEDTGSNKPRNGAIAGRQVCGWFNSAVMVLAIVIADYTLSQ